MAFHTHLSGTGVSDYGDVLFSPTVGEVLYNNGADGNAGYSSQSFLMTMNLQMLDITKFI